MPELIQVCIWLMYEAAVTSSTTWNSGASREREPSWVVAGGTNPGRQKLNTEPEVSGAWLSEVFAEVDVMVKLPLTDAAPKARAQLVTRITGSRSLPKVGDDTTVSSRASASVRMARTTAPMS